MQQMKRRLLTILLAAVLVLGIPAFAQADEDSGGGDNTAVAINKKDGATVVKTAFSVRHVMNGIVDQRNAAVAFATCTDCTTAAIAVQIVLVERPPTVVTPQNVALAINQVCSLCVTVANALQFVKSTDGPAQFDDFGQETLHQIAAELHQIRDDLKDGNLALDQLQAQIDSMRLRIRDVLANHLVDVQKQDGIDEQDGRAATTTAPDTATSSTTPGANVDDLTTEALTTTTP
jgi:putative peptide zinc metalloprotease protein